MLRNILHQIDVLMKARESRLYSGERTCGHCIIELFELYYGVKRLKVWIPSTSK